MLVRSYRNFSTTSITMAMSQMVHYSRLPEGDKAIFIKQDAFSRPAISFHMNKRLYKFEFNPETVLSNMRQNILKDLSGTVHSVNFYAPDGIELSKRSTFKHLMNLPFFTMKTNLASDRVKNFVVIPQSTLESHPVNSVLSSNQKTIYDDLVSSGVPSDKAIELAKLNSTLSEMM